MRRNEAIKINEKTELFVELNVIKDFYRSFLVCSQFCGNCVHVCIFALTRLIRESSSELNRSNSRKNKRTKETVNIYTDEVAE